MSKSGARRWLARCDGWLGGERIAAHATVLAICLWGLYAASLSTPGLRDRSGQLKGSDFLQFYVAGSFAHDARPARLYDYPAFRARGEQLVPESRGTSFLPVYGPQVALLCAPLAQLPYGVALALWLVAGAGLYAVSCRAIWATCSHLRGAAPRVALLAVAYPPLFSMIGHGQSSALALACFAAGYRALHAGRPTLAGFAIGCLFYKPQLGLACGLVWLLAGERRIVFGALAAILLQLAAAWLLLGGEALLEYGRVASRLGALAPVLGFKPYQMHSLRALFAPLLPGAAAQLATAVTSLATLLLALRVWRSAAPLQLRFAMLLLASALVNPHQYMYDLVILAPAILLLADLAVERGSERGGPALRVLLYLSYLLPVLGPLSRVTHVQLSVPAFAGLALLLHNLACAPLAARRRAAARPGEAGLDGRGPVST